jgi:hypothetical protein
MISSVSEKADVDISEYLCRHAVDNICVATDRSWKEAGNLEMRRSRMSRSVRM